MTDPTAVAALAKRAMDAANLAEREAVDFPEPIEIQLPALLRELGNALYDLRAAPLGAAPEKCGERAQAFIPRWGMSWACVLPKGHEGEHQGGGTCFKHGDYVGRQCPKFPDCAVEAVRPVLPEGDAYGKRMNDALRDLVAAVWDFLEDCATREQLSEAVIHARRRMEA